MPDCPHDSTLEAFFNGQIESESEIDHLCQHLDHCDSCQQKLDQLQPSSYESEFRGLLMGDAELDELTQCTIDEQLATAEELSKKIIQSVSPPSPTGENKKDRFRPERMIGAGHFFRCLQVHDLWTGHSVAVKVPINGFLTSTAHHIQFLNDCHSAIKLKHPNIAATLDFGRWDDRHWFVSSQLLEAKPLHLWLTSHRPGFSEVMGVLSQICGAVRYAHHCNVVHRHLDCNNTLITRDDHAWLTDFGFVLDQRYQFDLIQVHKKPSPFLPKEFLTFNSGQWVDERSDIYSVGQIIEHCLSQESVAEEAHGLSNPIIEIARKCTQWSRSNRFQSIDNVILAIQKLDSQFDRFGDSR